MKNLFCISSGLALLLVTVAPGDAQITVEPGQQAASYTLKYNGRPILVYTFAPGAYKPYIKELCTVNGDNILRDSPFDHLHHHALMYAIKVNGVNFWEEVSGNGVQKVVKTEAPVSTQAGSAAQTTIEQTLHWLRPEDAFLPNTNAPALLVEKRTLKLTVDPTTKEVAVHWRSQFEVGTRTNEVVLTGANYHGLGMRFIQEFDSLANHSFPEGKPDLANGKQDTSPHPWAAVSFDHPQKPATVVLFGDPRNARGSPTFFSMKTPFAYLSATQGLDREPLIYHSGDTFELNYLVCVYPGVVSHGSLLARAKQWESSSR